MKKNTAKILVAALALIMALGIATGSTFAWFSLNSKVAVTGMQVKTTVKNNLQIAEDTTGVTSETKLSSFKTNDLGSALSETLLEPVSTINGTDFYYNSTLNTKASDNGDAIRDEYIAYNPANTTAFNSNYGTSGAVGYVDYVFQLSATNTHSSDSYDVAITALDLVYSGATTPAENAFRVAVFVEDITSSNPSGNVGTLKTILQPEYGDYFTDNKAVKDTGSLDTVSNLGTAATLATLAHGTSGQYKVVVRLWIEGEDESNDNETFATLTADWALNMTIELVAHPVSGASGVTVINNTRPGTTAADLSSATLVDPAEDVVIDGVTYHKIDSVTLGGANLYTSSASVASNSKIYTITSNQYLTEVTKQCKLPTT